MAEEGRGGAPYSSATSSSSLDGGAFLLQLLRNPPQPSSLNHQQRQRRRDVEETLNPHLDPAVAAVGPTYPFLGQDLPLPSSPPSSSSSFPPGFSRSSPPGFPSPPPPPPRQFSAGSSPPLFRGDFLPNSAATHHSDGGGRTSGGRTYGVTMNLCSRAPGRTNGPINSMHQNYGPLDRNRFHQNAAAVQRPPAMMVDQIIPRNHRAAAEWVPSNDTRDGHHHNTPNNRDGKAPSFLQREMMAIHHHQQHNRQFNAAGSSMGRKDGFFEESNRERVIHDADDFGFTKSDVHVLDDYLPEHLEDSLMLGDTTTPENSNNNVVRTSNHLKSKDARLDLFRGHNVSSQRARIRKRELRCRFDIDNMTPLFLAIYRSLIPADEEIENQKQLLRTLEKLVNKEWPDARLHLYGSCANSFGVSNSDIDLCLAIDESNMSKPEILLKLADILQSGNLQNVQALTHARVPIVKMMDPATGISCDICINNLLAVANTKLLRDYAQIDDRLRQLAFIVKHWAKSRGVNETYRGTLSSYAYVLMCIHFLQQQEPAILPCLQEMEPTYVVTVDGTQCAYFDQINRLRNFGAQNNESVSRLLWGFFRYWAYCHDYTNDVISVRTGRNISKQLKDWTRRVGNDRHLICIEDPFETSHDLGRVVDKFSIKILREEFERAADIMQYDANPSVTLFEPYVPQSMPNGLQYD